MNIEEVRKAAELVERHKTRHAHQPFDVLVAAMRTLSDWAIMELSIRDAERIERAKPIDAEWCLANGAAWNNHRAVAWWRILDNSRLEFNSTNGVALITGDGWAYFDDITTRGQLLDLLAALKGGES